MYLKKSPVAYIMIYKRFSRCDTKALFDYLKDVKSIGFLGFGKSNRALLDFLSERIDFRATVRDEREILTPPERECRLLTRGACFSPPFEDLIFLSPSVKRDRPEIERMIDSGTRISSDAELFFALCDRPILAVSGSDGKSTTVKMAEAILRLGGTNALALGNVGIPFVSGLESDYECFIAEISSFTLEYTEPRTRRALITNITENHLNWHGSFERYIAAKENLLSYTCEAVMSPDTDACLPLIERHKPRYLFSASLSYCELKARFPFSEFYFTHENDSLSLNGVPLIPISALSKKEPHNIKNALAALALTHGFLNTGGGHEALSDFRGLSHRIEFVATANGVSYIDSSIDSSPERTKSTLLSLGENLHILLGGRGKGLSYAPLIEPLLEKSGYIVISGENRRQIETELSVCKALIPRIIVLDTLEDAVRTVIRLSHFGDTVLLSPASTSYDAYSSFEERGEKFKDYIKRYTEGTK